MVSRDDGLEVGFEDVGFDEGEPDGLLLGMLDSGRLDGLPLGKLVVGGLEGLLLGKLVVGGLESVEGVGISVVGIDVVG